MNPKEWFLAKKLKLTEKIAHFFIAKAEDQYFQATTQLTPTSQKRSLVALDRALKFQLILANTFLKLALLRRGKAMQRLHLTEQAFNRNMAKLQNSP